MITGIINLILVGGLILFVLASAADFNKKE